jgi:catechol 2,3-dioxygenase-like lactoylglutathione lyase family enzyme
MTKSVPAALFIGAWLLIGAGVPPALAQTTLPFDHIGLVASAPPKAAAWWIQHLGGGAGVSAERVAYGTAQLIFAGGEAPGSPAAPGGVVDHIGISVASVDAKLNELTAAGAKTLEPPHQDPGLFKAALVEDPWGVRVEIVEDPSALGLHHIHVRAANPAKALKQYQQVLGGERGKLKNRADGLRYGTIWVLVGGPKDFRGPASTSKAVDHLAWRVENVDAEAARVKALGLKVVGPQNIATVRNSFVPGADGEKVELIQRFPAKP